MLGSVIINELERRSDQRESAVDMDIYHSHDIDKLWVKLERSAEAGSTDEAALQLLYSRAIAPFWDWKPDCAAILMTETLTARCSVCKGSPRSMSKLTRHCLLMTTAW